MCKNHARRKRKQESCQEEEEARSVPTRGKKRTPKRRANQTTRKIVMEEGPAPIAIRGVSILNCFGQMHGGRNKQRGRVQ
jgi:hypothetical protein